MCVRVHVCVCVYVCACKVALYLAVPAFFRLQEEKAVFTVNEKVGTAGYEAAGKGEALSVI